MSRVKISALALIMAVVALPLKAEDDSVVATEKY